MVKAEQIIVAASIMAAPQAAAFLFRSAGARAAQSLIRVRGGAAPLFSTVASNALLDQSGLPKFDKIEPSQVKPAVSELLSKLETDLESLEKNLATKTASPDGASYSDVVEAMEVIESPIEYAWGVVSHLTGVMNGDELRAAHQELQPDVIKVTTKIAQSKAVYSAVEQVEQRAKGSLDEAQRRILASSLAGMKLSGVGLEGDLKDKFNLNRVRLAELSTLYSNNLLDATQAFSLTLTAKEDVAGLPPSALALCAQMAQAAAAKAEEGSAEATAGAGATAEAGPWRIGLDMPTYLPAMQHLESSKVREELYRAFISRAGEENAPLISEILQLRAEQARILGFNTYAEMSLERKMAEDVVSVAALTEQLRAKAHPAALEELVTLTAFAKSKGFEGDQLQLWDVAYWSEKQSEELFGFEEEELRPYFALPNVLKGLFGLCKRLFGVDIVEADGDAPTWHPDVRFFKVQDEASGEHLASFYLDPYSRPATKRGGAWMGTCTGKSSVVPGREQPVAYLTCNGSPPVGDKPSLMTFSEVTTLFHEMGHGLQHMLTKVPHAAAAGISGVEWDAVELPSQFMENWCYDEQTVYGSGLAKHYETGEPLPKKLFAKLKERSIYQAGMVMLRQLYFGTLDMELHGDYDPATDARTPFQVQKEIASHYTVLPPLEEDKFLCAFGHIFAGGYSAGYYSYKWAEVLSADAFAAFEEAGLDKEAEVRATGRKFRETVLALGGGRHPSDVFRDFRGKDASPEALLRHSGLL
mmetsp:Transcript_50391/g.114382  ORF Transcript_50391/g.114382 Transcript_50391/m.114382 type:complete len:756 (-) Transcript_50391:245-2512(-)